MPKIVGVRFRQAGKVYHFDAAGFDDLASDEQVVVETSKGEEIGEVVVPPKEVSEEEASLPLRPVIRRATPCDLLELGRFRRMEPEALKICRQKVEEHSLPMKVVRAEYNFAGKWLTFFFTAESRVDFRDLVRNLAGHFKTKIELRQIGVRDEAKLMGGLGRCGRILCCKTFLCEFSPVSIRMAKNQDLPLNPTEISGICGRLLCCLAYENGYYTAVKDGLPKVGERVITAHGPGKVTGANVPKGTVKVTLDSEVTMDFPPEELKRE